MSDPKHEFTAKETSEHRQEKVTSTQVLDTFALVDMISQRVLKEITDKDGLQLGEIATTQVIAKLRSTDEISKLVKKDFSSRLRLVVTAATILGVLLTWIGISRLDEWLRAKAAAEAERHLSETFGRRLDQFDKKADERLREFNGRLDRFRQEAQDDFKRIEDKIETLRTATRSDVEQKLTDIRQKAADSLQQVKDSTGSQAKEFSDKLQTIVESKLREISDRAKIIDDSAKAAQVAIQGVQDSAFAGTTKKFDEALQAAKKDLEQTKETALQQIRLAGQAKDKSDVARKLLEKLLDDGSSDDKYDEEQRSMHATRNYSDVVRKAERMARDDAMEAARMTLEPVLVAPEKYTPEERRRVADLILGPNVNSIDKRGHTVELAIVAARANDMTLADAVRTAKDSNVHFQLQPNALLEFALAALGSGGEAAVRQAFRELDFDTLTSRGLANVLVLCKQKGFPDADLKKVEAALLGKLLKPSTIDRPTDYLLSRLYLQALDQKPVFDRETIGKVLDRIELKVFSGRFHDIDPWNLRAMIENLRKQ